ncbi:hypothetical protein [Streptomyces sp. TLI_171]|uniref:hypothetical protein n=1 Tax=Streptomyces sp. TLI_171 TaxID=1938859 RepID=UPI000C186A0C|nr:hypothetical protein [Streptomyces sp. TLI_171]
MEITLTVRDPDPAFQAKLLALLAEHAPAVTLVPDDRWTTERARAYYDRLPPRAAQILLALVRNGGHIPADDVRVAGGSLRGATGAFSRILREGAHANPPRWPAALPNPVHPIHVGGSLVRFDLGTAGPNDCFPVFKEALAKVARNDGSNPTSL